MTGETEEARAFRGGLTKEWESAPLWHFIEYLSKREMALETAQEILNIVQRGTDQFGDLLEIGGRANPVLYDLVVAVIQEHGEEGYTRVLRRQRAEQARRRIQGAEARRQVGAVAARQSKPPNHPMCRSVADTSHLDYP